MAKIPLNGVNVNVPGLDVAMRALVLASKKRDERDDKLHDSIMQLQAADDAFRKISDQMDAHAISHPGDTAGYSAMEAQQAGFVKQMSEAQELLDKRSDKLDHRERELKTAQNKMADLQKQYEVAAKQLAILLGNNAQEGARTAAILRPEHVLLGQLQRLEASDDLSVISNPALKALPAVPRQTISNAVGQREAATKNLKAGYATSTAKNTAQAASSARVMAANATDPAQKAGYEAMTAAIEAQFAGNEANVTAADAGIPLANRLTQQDIPEVGGYVAAMRAGQGDMTPRQLKGKVKRIDGSVIRLWVQGARVVSPAFGKAVAAGPKKAMDELRPEVAEAIGVHDTNAGISGAEDGMTSFQRMKALADEYRKAGVTGVATDLDRKARGQFRKLPGMLGAAAIGISELPANFDPAEKQGLRNRLIAVGKDVRTQGQAFDAEDAASALKKQQDRDAAKAQREADRIAKAGLKRSEGLSGDYDDMVASTDAGFSRLRGLNAERKHLNTTGDTEGGEDVRKSGEKQSALLMRQIAALEGLAKALELDGQQQKADDLRSKMGDWQKQASGGLTENAERFGGSGVGELLAKGLKDIPGVGKVAHAMFGSSVAKAVNNSVVGQFVTGVGAKLAGQALPEALEGSRFAAQGIKAVEGVRALAATPLVGAAATIIAAPIAVAVGALLMLNSKANGDFKAAAGARNEEIRFGDVGNRIGTSDRLLNDIRDPKSKHLDDRLLKMRYGSADYASTVDSMGLVGMSAEGRKSAAMTAMQFSRATGMSLSESGSLAGTLGRSDASRGGNVAADLMKFAAVIKQGVKEGVASDEMSRNFQSALERSKTSAGGIVSAKGRSDLMDQIMAGLQTGNARLKGDAGASTIGNMNAAIAGFEGKDVAFAANALKGKTAKQLGLSGAGAKTYDTLMNTAKDPYDAIRFALKNQTKETRTLIADKVMGAAGGSPAVAIQMLEKGLGVEYNAAASSVSKAVGKDGKLIPGAKIDVMEAFKGNFDKSKTPKDGMTEAQDKNGGYQTGGRQEMRANEVKLLAEKVIFSSNFNNKNIENSQGINTAIQQGRNGIVENVGNPISRALLNIQNGPQTGYITDVLKNDSLLSKFNGIINPTAYLQSRLRPPTGRASGGYGGDGGKFSEAGTYHGGEYIINSEVTSRMRPQLDRINGGGSPDMSGGTVKIDRDSLRDMASFITMSTVKGDLMGKPSVQDRTIAAQQQHPSGLSSIFSQGVDVVKGFVGRLFGGGRAPVGGGGSGSDAPHGVASGGNSSIAAMGEAGVSSSWAESIAGYCSKFVRQVFERSQGKADGSTSGSLFGATAIETGNLWKQKGLSMTPQQVAASGGYRPGDLVFQMSGSGGAGHVGIVTSDGQNVAENSTRGRGGKGIVSLAGFGQIDRVGRYGGIAPSAGVAGGGSLDSLIGAMGVAEGWGLKQVGGKWQMDRHNAATTAPFGLLGDSRAHPELMRNPQLLHDFMVGKLTGKVLPSVAAMGVKGFGSTVIPGLVGSDGQVTGGGMSALQKKWAPTGVANDPRHLNENWLSNVTAQMNRSRAAQGQSGTPQMVSVVISGNVGIDGKPNAAATQGVVSAIVKGMARNGIPVKVAPVQSARHG